MLASFEAFKAYLAAGHRIYSTTFIDEHGRFAKDPDAIHTVAVDFIDGESHFNLSAAQFSSLPKATKQTLYTQQSGNVPNPLASNA